MITITAVFVLMIAIFAAIGALRGWAKELLVTFSAILALFVIILLEKYVLFIQEISLSGDLKTELIIRIVVLGVLAFFGYQTPRIQRLVDAARKESFQDTLFGAIVGAINGYLIWGSVWAFIHKSEYFFKFIQSPEAGTDLGDSTLALIEGLPPIWIDAPEIYFFIAIAFIFVIKAYN